MLETVAPSVELEPRLQAPNGPRASRRAVCSGSSAVGLALGVATVLVAGKAVLLPWTGAGPLDVARWLLRLGIVSAADLRFAALLGVALALLARAAPRSRAMRGGLLAVATTAALYGVAGVAMFRLLMVPLTVPLLSFGGGPLLMASSLSRVTTPAWLLAGLAALLTPWAMRCAWERLALERWVSPKRWAAVVCLVLAYAALCDAYVASRWTDPNRWERRIARNPHAAFLVSLGEAATGGDAFGLAFTPTRVDESDFVPRASKTLPLPASNEPRPRNLIVIVLESVGVEYLGLYGARYDTTPHLARLAQERGVVFENCYAHAPSSPKGLVALVSSVYPGIDWKLISRDAPQFDVPTLPSVLREEGYRACYAHSGYWGWKNRDTFLQQRGVNDVIDASTIPARQVSSWGISDAELFQAGLDWIDRQPDQPFHLLLWTIETHHPYIEGSQPRAFGVDDPELNRYLNALRNVDALIGRLVDELERRGLADSTLIAVTGDHGEAFGQHGQRVHSFGVYDENVHVPLVLIEPRTAQVAAQRIPEVCQQIDIAPTLLARLGQAAPPEWQGRDAQANDGERRAYFYSTGNEVLLGLREGRWKYHYAVGDGREELFDLEADPEEEHNIVDREPRRAADYRVRVGGLVTYQRRFLAQHGVK